jgi:hypothetical protein
MSWKVSIRDLAGLIGGILLFFGLIFTYFTAVCMGVGGDRSVVNDIAFMSFLPYFILSGISFMTGLILLLWSPD